MHHIMKVTVPHTKPVITGSPDDDMDAFRMAAYRNTGRDGFDIVRPDTPPALLLMCGLICGGLLVCSAAKALATTAWRGVRRR